MKTVTESNFLGAQFTATLKRKWLMCWCHPFGSLHSPQYNYGNRLHPNEPQNTKSTTHSYSNVPTTEKGRKARISEQIHRHSPEIPAGSTKSTVERHRYYKVNSTWLVRSASEDGNMWSLLSQFYCFRPQFYSLRPHFYVMVNAPVWASISLR